LWAMRDELRAKGGYLHLVHRRREHNTRADSYATLATMPGHGRPLPADLVARMPQRLHPYIRDLNPGFPPPLPAERSMDLRYSRAQIDDMFLEDLGIQVCDSARLLGAPIGDLLSAYADHFLRDRARHADSLTGKLHLLDDHRSEYLLLYYCSSARRRFQPRVTPYTALGPYIEQADRELDIELARQLLVHGSNTGRGLSLSQRDEISLPPSQGGAGIPRCSETAPAACIAAWASSLPLMRAHFAAQSTACGGGGLERFTEHTLLSDKLKDRRGVAVPDPMGVVAAHAHLKEHRDWLHDSNNAQAIKVAANGQADAPTKLGVTAYATIKMSKKPTEKSLSSLVNTRVRTRLLTVWTDGAYCPYDVIPTNMDRRRIVSCSGFFSHAWMMAPGRLARLGVESPQMPAYAFRKALLFRMGLPIPADDGGPGDRVCRCGSFGPDPFGHHSVACPHGAGMLLRHNELESAMLHMAAECGLSATRGLRQHWPSLRDPPPNVNATYTADLVLHHFPTQGMTYLGDFTIGHPNARKYVRITPQPAVPLDTADTLGKGKHRKISKFLDALRVERNFVPPAAEKFVPLPMESYGAAGKELVSLFKGFVSRWKEMRHATESQVSIFRHKWRYRISTAVQARNAEMLSLGLLKWSCRS
jgi:hypothetical protein